MNSRKRDRKMFDLNNNTHLGVLLAVLFVGACVAEVVSVMATTHDARCLFIKCIVVK